MRKGEKIGRLGVSLDAKDFTDLRDSARKPEEIYADSAKACCEQEIHTLEEEKEQIDQEKKDRGSPSLTVILSKIKQEIFFVVMVIITVIGEFIFGEWFIGPFGLGDLKTIFLALTFTLILILAVDIFFSALEAKWPQHSSTYNLVFGSIGFILVFWLIYMASDIRGLMFRTASTLQSVTSAEETVGVAKEFFEGASKPFLVLMMVLTAAITLIGGITYHRVKERLFALLPLRGLYKRGKRIEKEILRKRQAITDQDAMIAQFAATFSWASQRKKPEEVEKGYFPNWHLCFNPKAWEARHSFSAS